MSPVWKEQKERSNPFTLRLICWIALNTSRRLARLWLYPITLYFLLTAPTARVASKNYLRRIPGKTGNIWQVTQHIFCFSATILDRVYFLTDQKHRFDIKVEGRDILDKLLEQNSGCILLGAHIGSFEALRCLAISYDKLPLKIMMYSDHNAMITKILDELNPTVADSVINLADDDALLKMKECIDEGDLIGMLGDRVSKGEKFVTCTLLGEQVNMTAGPISLASIMQVPVIVFYGIYHGGNKYSIFIENLSDSISAPRKSRSQVVADYMQQFSNSMEVKIKQYPYNWFNFFDYFGDAK